MKKYIVTILILIGIWAIMWMYLSDYENQYPNSSISEFAKTIYYDLDNIAIVKNSNDLYDVYKKDKKVISVIAKKISKRWNINLCENYIEPIKIFVPKDSDVYIDNNLISGNNIVEHKVSEAYKELKEIEEYPKVECYEINNYFNIPKVEVFYKFKECKIDVEERTINAFFDLESKEEEILRNNILEASKKYARFISNDISFLELSKHLYSDTKFYKDVKTFFNDWYAHTGYDFREERVYNIMKIADNAFSGEVSFDYILKKGQKEYVYPSHYKVYFSKIDDEWKVVLIETK